MDANKMREQVRQQFEAWWKSTMNTEVMDLERCSFPLTEYVDQPYACHETGRAWMAWQASREAAVVELPKPDGSFENHEYLIDRELTVKAIEAQGLNVEVKP